jgi:hypothetical protein
VAATRAALGAHDLARKRRHFGIVRIFRRINQALVAAGVVKAGRDKSLHAEVAHVAEGHRLAGRVLGSRDYKGHQEFGSQGMPSSDISRSDNICWLFLSTRPNSRANHFHLASLWRSLAFPKFSNC